MNKSLYYIILLAFIIAFKDTLVKMGTNNIPGYSIFYLTILFGAIISSIIVIFYKPSSVFKGLNFSKIGWLFLIAIFETAICIGIIYMLSNNNLSLVIPSLVSFIVIFAFLSGICILKEEVNLYKLLGVGLILGGIGLLHYTGSKIKI
tara:strand:- start:41 stop:484 length:444 start_codon:yes stop_codon:yes gene_type:complete